MGSRSAYSVLGRVGATWLENALLAQLRRLPARVQLVGKPEVELPRNSPRRPTSGWRVIRPESDTILEATPMHPRDSSSIPTYSPTPVKAARLCADAFNTSDV